MAEARRSTIRQRGQELAEKIAELHYQRQPEIWEPYGQAGREKCRRDAAYNLSFLAEAIEADEPRLFSEYLGWLKVLFAGLNFPDHVLITTLGYTRQILDEELTAEEHQAALRILDTSTQVMEAAPSAVPSFIQGFTPLDDLARRYLSTLLQAERRSASDLILQAVREGVSIRDIYVHVFQRTQREIGRLWQMNQISVAQEHFCTAATQMIMSQLYPYLFTGKPKDRAIVVACVGGELHEIGARMVADLFEMEGWDSHFVGANTPPESIVRTVKERGADAVALSATMTFHVSKVSDLIRRLREDVAVKTRVLVGGYPFNLSPNLWVKIGADGYAPDAESAVREAERLVANE